MAARGWEICAKRTWPDLLGPVLGGLIPPGWGADSGIREGGGQETRVSWEESLDVWVGLHIFLFSRTSSGEKNMRGLMVKISE